MKHITRFQHTLLINQCLHYRGKKPTYQRRDNWDVQIEAIDELKQLWCSLVHRSCQKKREVSKRGRVCGAGNGLKQSKGVVDTYRHGWFITSFKCKCMYGKV